MMNVDDFFDYGWALIKTVLNAQNNNHLHGDDWQRSVYIDTLGIGTTDFDLSETNKKQLVKSGSDGTRTFFDWYDSAKGKNLPFNNPNFKIKP